MPIDHATTRGAFAFVLGQGALHGGSVAAAPIAANRQRQFTPEGAMAGARGRERVGNLVQDRIPNFRFAVELHQVA